MNYYHKYKRIFGWILKCLKCPSWPFDIKTESRLLRAGLVQGVQYGFPQKQLAWCDHLRILFPLWRHKMTVSVRFSAAINFEGFTDVIILTKKPIGRIRSHPCPLRVFPQQVTSDFHVRSWAVIMMYCYTVCGIFCCAGLPSKHDGRDCSSAISKAHDSVSITGPQSPHQAPWSI